MNVNWIILETFFVFLRFYGLSAEDVYVNINLDFLGNRSTIKIYNQSLDTSNCTDLDNKSGEIFLKLGKDLKSKNCFASGVLFHIFTYHTNISSAIVTIQNKGFPPDYVRYVFKKLRVIILDEKPEYVSFVTCEERSENCIYNSFNHTGVIAGNNMTIYSACSRPNDGQSCLTMVDFSDKFNEADSQSKILGNKLMIIGSIMKPVSVYKCLNGGVLVKDNETGQMKCDCPRTTDFVESGPNCEALQQNIIKQKQYLYCLPNTDKLRIEFSLYSVGYKGLTELMVIENDNKIMNYSINDIHHTFSYLNNTLELKYPPDIEDKPLDISIEISKNMVKFRINDKENSTSFSPTGPLLLDTLPLIIGNATQNLCLSNLVINSKIIDLYTPTYLPCASEFCLTKCNNSEKCIFLPFKSSSFVGCICKVGYSKNQNDQICHKDPDMAGEIPIGKNASIHFSLKEIRGLSFLFRTLLSNERLLSLSFNQYVLTIAISNGKLVAVFTDEKTNKTRSLSLDCCEVADGNWHDVHCEFNNIYWKIWVDEKISYNRNGTKFYDFIMAKDLTGIENGVIVFGSIHSDSPSKTNLSTCFDTLKLKSVLFINTTETYISLNKTLTSGCKSGIDCSTLKCLEHQSCHYSWQNTSCICIEGFEDKNGSCIFSKCLNIACKNGGHCTYDDNMTDFKCICAINFMGKYCEVAIEIALFPYWVIIIIILILLIILLVILIFCFYSKKDQKKKYLPDINNIYEDTVSYKIPAGEEDYNGYPINFEILSKALKDKEYHTNDADLREPQKKFGKMPRPVKLKNSMSIVASALPSLLLHKKEIADNRNEDLVLDFPLEYGYEGGISDLENLSSSDSDNH